MVRSVRGLRQKWKEQRVSSFDSYSQRYYVEIAAAFLRGMALNAHRNGGLIQSVDPAFEGKKFFLPEELTDPSLADLSETEIAAVLDAGEANDMKLYRFKNTHDDLPRVRRVLGFLRGVVFDSLLDVGSGRGVFLWTCLNTFPGLQVTAIDLLPEWSELYHTVRAGGMNCLDGRRGDIIQADFPDKSFDIVTLLEVLEHIPDYAAAIRAAVRLARRHIIVSVPSKPDDNPAHIHLLTRDILEKAFQAAGVTRLHFDGVNNSLVLFATLD